MLIKERNKMKNDIRYLTSMIVMALSLSTLPIIAKGVSNDIASLKPVTNCPTLLAELKQAAVKEMEKRIDNNLQYTLGGFGCIVYEYPAVAASMTSSDVGAGEYSETNVQVVGVDEADFVKNDGSYIYILANGKFRIIDAWPPEEASEIAAVEIEGTPKKLFVHEGKAFIYSSLEPVEWNHYNRGTECTYGYDCEFTGDGHQLKITILDISQVTNPRLIREIHFSGAYLNARRIGNAVHSVVIFPEFEVDDIKYWPDEFNYGCMAQEVPEEDIKAAFEALKAKNRDRIQSAGLDEWLPSAKDTRYSGDVAQESQELFNNCDNFYSSQQTEGKNLLSIISTDINGQAPLNIATIISKPGAIYASKSALYLAARHSSDNWQNLWFFPDNITVPEATTLHKFSLNNNDFSSQYVTSGVVKGRVLNQFAMDEFQGFLRIATTTGHLPDPNTHSTISILNEQNGKLVVVGQVDNIAPTEDIRSVRFIGNQGYVVTFKKTDPLFIFDLADPSQPRIAGELKIPGFSTYMHPLDDNHLLTIGYDADDQGSFAWFQGIMLQIFDITDMTQPTLTHKEVIGTRGSTSEAATNHLAFNYFSSKGLLAIPMTICERNDQYQEKYSGGNYGDLMKFSGLLIYKVNAETGFDWQGGVPHIAPENSGTSWQMCFNWWTRSNSYVKRSIFMGDYVFSITEDTIKANHLAAIGQDVAVVHLTEQLQCDPFHVDFCVTDLTCSSINGEWVEGNCRLPLYSPRQSSVFSKDLCAASYEPVTNMLTVPCVTIKGIQYQAELSLTASSPSQLKLVSLEQPEIRKGSHRCEITFDPVEDTMSVPCLLSGEGQYWAHFKRLNETPLIMQLMEFDSLK